jgi:hypothetical protein
VKDRMLKYYENLRVVYEVEARLRDLQRQQDDSDRAAQTKPTASTSKKNETPKDKR